MGGTCGKTTAEMLGVSHAVLAGAKSRKFISKVKHSYQAEWGPHVTREGLSLGGRNGIFVMELVQKALTPWSVSVSCLDF